jgi:hypothetical protein
MIIDDSAWSGEGEFTAVLIEALKRLQGIDAIKIEDAPASRAESGYNFLSNEIYVRFRVRVRLERTRRWGMLPGWRWLREPAMSLEGLARLLAAHEGIGEADYADEGMVQYLRAKRIVTPYQTRGVKLVELVRVYEIRRQG